MTEFPDDRRYTRAHEWARDEDGHLGITDDAQEQLGGVGEVDLPDPGAFVTAGAPLGEVEFAKSIAAGLRRRKRPLTMSKALL
ncbi:MAG: glycine cleavage system protein H [Actinomycetota bacterium]